MFTRREGLRKAMQILPHRQFSLRFLLLLVSAVAVLCAAWRSFGAAGVALALFAMLSVAMLVSLPRMRKLGFVLSWSAIYGPFVAMATYTTIFVSCSHCKSTAWSLLPCAPGIIPLELARHAADLPRVSDTLAFALSLSVSVAMLITTAVLIHKTIWWRIIALLGLLVYEAFAASAVLAMIRM
jgi:hypothetical protein